MIYRLSDAQRALANQLSSVKFESNGINATMNLQRLYVLIDEGTCSASELLINGFEPYLTELILIGSKTCGKPVSFLPTTICADQGILEQETFLSATFLISNSEGDTNYFDGFNPTCEIEEERQLPPGDITDEVIAEALNHILTQSCRSNPFMNKMYSEDSLPSDG